MIQWLKRNREDLSVYSEGVAVALAVGIALFWSGFYVVVTIALMLQRLLN